MDWKARIKQRGMKRTAEALGLTPVAVRKWALGISPPTGDNLRNLVALMNRELTEDEFEQFISTLQLDLLGMVPVRQAVESPGDMT